MPSFQLTVTWTSRTERPIWSSIWVNWPWTRPAIGPAAASGFAALPSPSCFPPPPPKSAPSPSPPPGTLKSAEMNLSGETFVVRGARTFERHLNCGQPSLEKSPLSSSSSFGRPSS